MPAMSDLKVGDRVVVSTSMYDEGREGLGVIIGEAVLVCEDHQSLWLVRYDRYKRPKHCAKAFCYPAPRYSFAAGAAHARPHRDH
jgi:hypothetical protein